MIRQVLVLISCSLFVSSANSTQIQKYKSCMNERYAKATDIEPTRVGVHSFAIESDQICSKDVQRTNMFERQRSRFLQEFLTNIRRDAQLR